MPFCCKISKYALKFYALNRENLNSNRIDAVQQSLKEAIQEV